MFEFDLSLISNRSNPSDENAVTIRIDGKSYTMPQLVELKREVYSLRSENDVLNNSIDHYQKLIENNLVSIRCKELEKVVKDLEVIIQEQQKELDIRSDKIHNLQTELNVLEDTYEELLEVKEHMIDHVEEQQAIIEYQKKDIERLVKLNGDLQKELKLKNWSPLFHSH